MTLKLSVYTKRDELLQSLQSALGAETEMTHNPVAVEECEVVFVDANWPDRMMLLKRLAEQAAFVVLVAEEGKLKDSDLDEGLVDDVLLTPIRDLEARSKLRHFSHLAKFRELKTVNAGIKVLIEKIEDDLKMTRAIQRKFIPEKFVVPGFNINHKYLSGLKSGGDYLDIFEFDDRTHVGILMTDSAGYGLSSALMAVMLRMAFRFGRSEPAMPAQMVKRIFAELKMAMKPQEDFSIFYGLLNRRSLEMMYSTAGTVSFYQNSNRVNEDTKPLRREDHFKGEDKTVKLMPGDRLVFASDGYTGAFGNDAKFKSFLEEQKQNDAVNLINECSFQVKKTLPSRHELPTQDCSLIVMELERQVIRLAKG